MYILTRNIKIEIDKEIKAQEITDIRVRVEVLLPLIEASIASLFLPASKKNAA